MRGRIGLRTSITAVVLLLSVLSWAHNAAFGRATGAESLPAFTAADCDHILHDDFTPITKVSQIPPSVRNAYIDGAGWLDLASSNRPYQSGDAVVPGPRLPWRRLEYGAQSAKYCVLRIVHGGYAVVEDGWIYRLDSTGGVDAVWRIEAEDIRDLDTLRHAAGKGLRAEPISPEEVFAGYAQYRTRRFSDEDRDHLLSDALQEITRRASLPDEVKHYYVLRDDTHNVFKVDELADPGQPFQGDGGSDAKRRALPRARLIFAAASRRYAIVDIEYLGTQGVRPLLLIYRISPNAAPVVWTGGEQRLQSLAEFRQRLSSGEITPVLYAPDEDLPHPI